MPQYYAHSLSKHSQNEWQTLKKHLENVSTLANRFAQSFNSSQIASILGLLHDCGKATDEFQHYLLATNDSEENVNGDESNKHHKGPDHSTAAAQWMNANLKGIGALFGYILAGHHSGMPDGISEGNASLEFRLRKKIHEWDQNLDVQLPSQETLLQICKNEIVPFFKAGNFSISFYLKMLFSCLVDADFLDTENFMNNEQYQERNLSPIATIEHLREKLITHYKKLQIEIQKNNRDKEPIMVLRNEVKSDCEIAAKYSKGLFTLKVPTGGGKTLSSMFFALNHAYLHKMERVIYVVPFTTIIEQTANIYREIFGSENVLEIHCNIDPDTLTTQSKLLSENWDAPIIVTTNVQFFESMFANKTSKCRKLHNFANSVIILDEAQGIPMEVLKPCLKALEELSLHYGSSVVLCTATLPVFFNKHILGDTALTGGKRGIIDIIPDSRNLHTRLNRIHVIKLQNKISDSKIIELIQQENSVMVVVSTRKHARELYLALKKEVTDAYIFHLSAQMCGIHRTSVLQKVQQCLNNNQHCILISTQLIEAGVDIDFPCVYREIAGLDSMAQAAGRCNREGRLGKKGKVVLFESADYTVPAGFLRTAAQQGNLTTLLPDFANDLLGPNAVNYYFSALFCDANISSTNSNDRMDKYRVLSELIPHQQIRTPEDCFIFKFRELGEQFKLIDNATCNVIIPFGQEGKTLCEQLRNEFSPTNQRLLARKLQRYTVSMYGIEPKDEDGKTIADKIHDTYWILISPEMYYSEDIGLRTAADSDFLGIC